MIESQTFVAVLLHDERTVRDRAVRMPRPFEEPPVRLRIPITFANAAAFDVYDLVDPSGWPDRAVFCHVATVPKTSADYTRPPIDA
ncbi:hypothetical protein [Leifsonia sp. Le1]|uniref:hypothetical protein n=1 Tax=Leifsonia sp. Le1 TaxID=3404918 RepID=UPI003EB97EB7